MSIRVLISFGSTGVSFRRLPLMSRSAQRRRMALSYPRLAKPFFGSFIFLWPSTPARLDVLGIQTAVVKEARSRAFEPGGGFLFRCDIDASRSRRYSRLIPPQRAVYRPPRASTLQGDWSFLRLQPDLDQTAFLQDTLSLAYGQHGPFQSPSDYDSVHFGLE